MLRSPSSLGDALRGAADALNGLYRHILNLPPQASSMARRVDTLHYVEISAFFVIATVFTAAAIWIVIRFRKRPGDAPPARTRGPVVLVVYAGAMLVIFAGFWVASFPQYLALEQPPDDAMDVYVTAKQWVWKFSSPDGWETADVLYVPAGVPVRLVITSRDVIHSFYVPAFRIKQDAVPGTYTTAWFSARPGRYPVYCTELCGTNHSSMRATVVALPPDEYARMKSSGGALGSAPGSTLSDIGREAITTHGCVQCHSLDGSPHLAPTFAGMFGSDARLSDGRTLRIDEAYVTRSMMDPMADVVAGYEPIMPSYQGQIDPAQTAAIITYLEQLADSSVSSFPSGAPR